MHEKRTIATDGSVALASVSLCVVRATKLIHSLWLAIAVHCCLLLTSAIRIVKQDLSYLRDSARRLDHSASREKGGTDGIVMAIVASNTVKECDPKTLLKSIHCDLDAGAL